MAEQTSSPETYVNIANPTYERRHLARYAAADMVPFLLPHLNAGQRLLDVGCGPGSITCDLAARVAPGEVVGIEIQESQVAVARAVLFHLRDPLAAPREMQRLLAPGGLVAVADIDAGGNVVAPTLPAVARFLDFTYRVVEQSGGNYYLGRQHRGLLVQAGFV